MDLVQLLRSQARRYRCVNCGESMAECGINVLAQQGNRALVRVTCATCKDENLLQIIFQPELEAPAAEEEAGEAVPEREPITGDEILELHEILEGHRGGFRELLAPR